MKKKVFIALGVCIFLGLKGCGITKQDGLLGPIEFFLNKEGSIVALSFRE